MNRLIQALIIAAVLFLGPLFIWGLTQDYSAAVRQVINDNKPTNAKIHQARREIEKGTKALGTAKVELKRTRTEQSRIEDLLSTAPMPLTKMRQRHQELKRIVRQASQTGQSIRYADQSLSPNDVQRILVRQRTYLESYKGHQQALAKLKALEQKLESVIIQARQDRAVAESQLAYAQTLTRIASTISRASESTGLNGTNHPFGAARDTLLEVISLQETLLQVDEPSTSDGMQLFKTGEITTQ